jgi:toxin ParE2
VKFRVLSIAQRELVEAIQWYADRSAAAAVEFVDEYERALGEIKTRPQQFTRAECVESPRDIRQVLLHKFPYVVYYELTAEEVCVLAISHAARQPGYWREERT